MITLANAGTIQAVASAATSISYSIIGMERTASDAYKVLSQGQVSNSVGAIYTANAGGQTAALIKEILFANTTGGAVTLTIYINGTAASNQVFRTVIPANGSVTYDGKWTCYDASGFAQTAGATGPTGPAGRDAGLKYTYSTNTALTDPGAGFLKFDNATLSSITNFRISETDGDTNGIAALLATLDDSTSTARTTVTIVKDGAPANTLIFAVTGTLTDQGAWDSMPVTFISTSGTFANNDVVKVFFSRTGDKGDQGIQGNTGPIGTVVAGNGLTGGGSTSSVTVDAAAHADGSIVVNTDNIQVGVLATDAQHGNRGGGGIHANVVAGGNAGFMTGADKTKLDGIATGATNVPFSNAAPPNVASASAQGSTTEAAREDHTHGFDDTAHGSRGGGSLHANVVAAGAAGFMTGADKTKLDGIAAGATVGAPTSRLINTTAPLTGGGDLTADRTLAISPATSSTAGSLSASDKKIIDDLHYDVVADFNWIGNDSNDNGSGAGGATAWSAIMSALPTGARLFFPAGTYRTSVELTINVDKRITFQGVSRYASIIKTTSATAHIFHKSVAGWYDDWQDLGFQSSVTRTGGSAIHISAGNNVGMNMYRLWITGMFNGITAVGSQSANLSVWADLDISGITNGGRGMIINGDTINVMIHNATINAGAATTSACCEIRQSGAVQVTACDWIQGTNVLLIDSSEASGAGPQACYFTNCFFDQPQQSVVKIIGTRTANRIKFTQCGIATSSAGGTGGYHGIEVAGTGAGGVGTQTALPAGISIVDCDIYNQAGTGTGAGIRINGVQDINIQNSRITGWNGSGGCGVRATPSSGSVTSVRVNGCIIGPNSNLTITNATGIQLDAGNFARVSISDNGIYGWSVAGITDNATTTYTNQKNIADNDGAGLISGTVVARSTTLSVANTETEVIGFLAQGNVALKVGMELRFQASGIQTNTSAASTSVWRIRIGPTTLTGPVVGSWSCAMGTTARTNVPFYVFGQVTILSSTTAIGTITVLDNSTTRYALPTTTITAAVTIATGPADQRVQLTVISGAASTTWNNFAAEIQAVIP